EMESLSLPNPLGGKHVTNGEPPSLRLAAESRQHEPSRLRCRGGRRQASACTIDFARRGNDGRWWFACTRDQGQLWQAPGFLSDLEPVEIAGGLAPLGTSFEHDRIASGRLLQRTDGRIVVLPAGAGEVEEVVSNEVWTSVWSSNGATIVQDPFGELGFLSESGLLERGKAPVEAVPAPAQSIRLGAILFAIHERWPSNLLRAERVHPMQTPYYEQDGAEGDERTRIRVEEPGFNGEGMSYENPVRYLASEGRWEVFPQLSEASNVDRDGAQLFAVGCDGAFFHSCLLRADGTTETFARSFPASPYGERTILRGVWLYSIPTGEGAISRLNLRTGEIEREHRTTNAEYGVDVDVLADGTVHLEDREGEHHLRPFGGEGWSFRSPVAERFARSEVRMLSSALGSVLDSQTGELHVTEDGGRHWRVAAVAEQNRVLASRPAFMVRDHAWAGRVISSSVQGDVRPAPPETPVLSCPAREPSTEVRLEIDDARQEFQFVVGGGERFATHYARGGEPHLVRLGGHRVVSDDRTMHYLHEGIAHFASYGLGMVGDESGDVIHMERGGLRSPGASPTPPMAGRPIAYAQHEGRSCALIQPSRRQGAYGSPFIACVDGHTERLGQPGGGSAGFCDSVPNESTDWHVHVGHAGRIARLHYSPSQECWYSPELAGPDGFTAMEVRAGADGGASNDGCRVELAEWPI
ncbi:MAG: hypothetical protein AAF411_29605, partial [Myxococcota bacterium]